jgi:hypothetical protein
MESIQLFLHVLYRGYEPILLFICNVFLTIRQTITFGLWPAVFLHEVTLFLILREIITTIIVMQILYKLVVFFCKKT